MNTQLQNTRRGYGLRLKTEKGTQKGF